MSDYRIKFYKIKVVSLIKTEKQTQVTLELEKQGDSFKPTSLARLWIASKGK
jgi:hypothetical protein